MTSTIAFFNLKGGVGRTTLVYHLAHMLVRMNRRVLLVDLDPQANLSAMCLSPERLDELWPEAHPHVATVLGSVQPVLNGEGDVLPPHVEPLEDALGLLVGDPGLHAAEGELADAWPGAWLDQRRSHVVLGCFHRMVRQAAEVHGAQVVLLDMSPNLGAINHAVLLATDHVVTPLAPGMFSFQGLRPLGSALAHWREQWRAVLERSSSRNELPQGRMDPLGYVAMQTAMLADRTTRTDVEWLRRLPSEYHQHVLRDDVVPTSITDDPWYLGTVRHSHVLGHLAQDARKPTFALKPADGAVGAYAKAVMRSDQQHRVLAAALLGRLPPLDSVPP